MDYQSKLIGVIKKVTYRKRRTSESYYERCDFILENGITIICSWFYPNVRKGYKVKIVGDWVDDETFTAISVDRINPQLQLSTFTDIKEHKKEVRT